VEISAGRPSAVTRLAPGASMAGAGLNKLAHEWLSWTLLAEVGVISAEKMMARLARADAPASSAGQSVAELAADPRRQMAALAAALAPTAQDR